MSKTLPELVLTPLEGIPLVRAGDDLGLLIARAIDAAEILPAAGDVIALSQKIVSKAEGRQVRLADIRPSASARSLASELEADARMVEVVLLESRAIVAHGHGVLITEHRSGHVMANAGVDRSNTGASLDEALLLPEDADASAAALQRDLTMRFRYPPAVVIVDSVGRPFRQGVSGIAIGAAGLPALVDLRGEPDLFGRPLRVSISAFADQIAAAATLVMGEGAQGIPAVFIRGLKWSADATPARAILREPERDLFRGQAIDLPFRGRADPGNEHPKGGSSARPAADREADDKTLAAGARTRATSRETRAGLSTPSIPKQGAKRGSKAEAKPSYSSVVALSGGVGGAKLALGLYRILPPDSLTLIANPGDDFDLMGLRICPDSDTLLYTLAGIADADRGWGRAGESWAFMQAISELGGEDWFALGDRDLALHVERTRRLQAGESLSRITLAFARRFGLEAQIVPASDSPVRTLVRSAEGLLEFQRYFVREKCAPAVHGFDFEGAKDATPAPAALAALAAPDLHCIVICPSNPFVSIDPIFSVPGLGDAIRAANAPVIGVSPIVGGDSVKGPTAKMMRELGLRISNRSIEEHYGDRVDAWIIDSADEGDRPGFRRPVRVAPTKMRSLADRESLAQITLDYAAEIRSAGLGR